MIIYTDENIFMSPAQTLVNTVNTVGVMGKGVAKDFKKYYPQMYKKYRILSKRKQLNIGQLMISKEEPIYYRRKPTGQYRNRWVLNFPTKRHWRNKSKIEYIEAGLSKFVKEYKNRNIESISFPQLGVGNGGLNWNEVQEVMEYYLEKVDIPVYIHIYSPTIKDKSDKKIEINLNTPHDIWKKNIYLEKSILNDEGINCDGVILPNKKLYKEVKSFYNIEYLSLLNCSNNDKGIRLQLNTKNLLQSDSKYQQINLFDS
ncbi:macro domain-containing protein [Lactobacillus intestinalis]|uniref:macro domain-containing protein n=1 Tax=Lactobacillus intestinalis TaxID=151781 RepID=UPI0030EE1D0E